MLSAIRLYSNEELIADPALTSQIIALANAAFIRSKTPWPERWNFTNRFPTPQHLYDTIGPLGTLAVIIDDSVVADVDSERAQEAVTEAKGRPVACAALIPWNGGWSKEGAATEKGWEIKCVCVDGSAQYARTGLAVRLLDALEKLAIDKETAMLYTTESKSSSASTNTSATQDSKDTSMPDSSTRTLRLWILVAECINGQYWPKRGYREVRRKTESVGTWGSKIGFEMLVMARDVVWQITDPSVK